MAAAGWHRHDLWHVRHQQRERHRQCFFSDGTARKIDFTLTLTRVDPSLAALYGDIGKQAETLIGKAGDMAKKLPGMVGMG